MNILYLSAQEDNTVNKFIVGGTINYYMQQNASPYFSTVSIFSYNANDTKHTSFTFAPYIAKELNSRIQIGLQLEYRVGTFKEENRYISGQANPVDYKRLINNYGIELFSRHNIILSEDINLFLQPLMSYNFLSYDEIQNSNVTHEQNAHYLEIGLNVGISYYFNDWMGAMVRVGALNYTNGNWSIKYSDTKKNFSSFGSNLNLSTIFFGIEFRI